MIDSFEHKIKTEIKTLRAHDLWIMKDQFYSQVKLLVGNTANFTGITELICFRAIYHLMALEGNPQKEGIRKGNYVLYAEKKYPAKRGKNQYPDISINHLPEGKLSHIFSIKHQVGTAGKDSKDSDSPVITLLMKDRTHALPVLVQDINRIENIRHGKHAQFESYTLIFDQPKGRNLEMIRS